MPKSLFTPEIYDASTSPTSLQMSFSDLVTIYLLFQLSTSKGILILSPSVLGIFSPLHMTCEVCLLASPLTIGRDHYFSTSYHLAMVQVAHRTGQLTAVYFLAKCIRLSIQALNSNWHLHSEGLTPHLGYSNSAHSKAKTIPSQAYPLEIPA